MLAVERFAGVLRNLQARSADLQGVSPYYQLQPEGQSINLFTPYTNMNIYIKRYHYSPWGVDGECFVGSQKACDSVEHPTAYLPDGEYPITKDNYRLFFVRGNGPMKNLQGEICVGRHALRGFVLQTAEAYFKLSKRILKAIKNNESITLKITSVQL